MIFEDVSRDANKDIEESYNIANDDPNTKKVKVFVGWLEKGRTQQIELVTYFTNWQ